MFVFFLLGGGGGEGVFMIFMKGENSSFCLSVQATIFESNKTRNFILSTHFWEAVKGMKYIPYFT